MHGDVWLYGFVFFDLVGYAWYFVIPKKRAQWYYNLLFQQPTQPTSNHPPSPHTITHYRPSDRSTLFSVPTHFTIPLERIQLCVCLNLEPSIRIYHQSMHPNDTLSDHFLQQLYLNKNQEITQPVLQILGFQTSEHHPKEITIRLSDGDTFFDATLIGPYELANNKILVSPFTAYHGTMEFKKLDIIKIVDFFSKIDLTKICRLKMMIRKIAEIRSCDHKIGRPQDLSFYMQVNQLVSDQDLPPIDSPPQREERRHYDEVKICEDDEVVKDVQARPKEKKQLINNELQILGICKDRNPDDPLTYREIMNGYDGFFIGRLLRMKQTLKDGKETTIPMLALGFIDSAGEMLRLNLLGKMAARQQKQLKKGKCYYLKGLQVVPTKGSSYIKLRQKDYKLHALNQQSITAKFQEEYYHWQHQHDYIQSQNVDVVGVIQDIQEKTFYGTKSVGDVKQSKEVIRVVIRNKYKIVKVSFWADQLKNLLRFNLKKGETILIEDVKKKKLVFLDYSSESTLIKLQPNSELYNKLQHLLPQQVEYAKPINIQSLHAIQEIDKFNTRTHSIYAYLSRIYDDKMILKFCDLCKKKINLGSDRCYQCRKAIFSNKYNTNLEFSDYSGSLMVSVFDNVAEKLFGKSALEMSELKAKSEEYDRFMDNLSYQAFLIGVEIKNERFILRSAEVVKKADYDNWYKESICNIGKMRGIAEK